MNQALVAPSGTGGRLQEAIFARACKSVMFLRVSVTRETFVRLAAIVARAR